MRWLYSKLLSGVHVLTLSGKIKNPISAAESIVKAFTKCCTSNAVGEYISDIFLEDEGFTVLMVDVRKMVKMVKTLNGRVTVRMVNWRRLVGESEWRLVTSRKNLIQ
jgi:hypothetical protein